MRRRKATILAGLVGLVVLVGCGEGEPTDRLGEEEIPIEDVGEGLSIDTSADRREAAPEARLAGVLPEDFPRELPLHLPASLVELEEGRAATFLTSDGAGRVREDLLGRLRSGGWRVEEDGGGWTVRRGGRAARLRVIEARPGTRYRWEW